MWCTKRVLFSCLIESETGIEHRKRARDDPKRDHAV